MHWLRWTLGLNVVLGVLAFRDLLRFRPAANAPGSTWGVPTETSMFIATETAPMVVVGLAFWLFVRRRHVLFSLPDRAGPVWLVTVMFGLSAAVYGWSVYTHSPDLQGFSLIATSIGCLLLWKGPTAVRVCRVPLILLVFAIPFPAPLLAAVIWSFQCWTASLAGWLLNLIGTPVLVSAEIIRLPTETFQVIEGCSGLRSIVTVTMLAILMVDLFGRHGRHAFVLIAAAPCVAFVMNGLRVLTLILNPHSTIHSVHTAQGIAVLLGGMTVLYLIDEALQHVFGSTPPPPVVPYSGPSAQSGNELQRALAVSASLIVLIGIASFLRPWSYPPGYRGSIRIEEVVPYRIGSWEGEKAEPPNNDIDNVVFYQAINRRYRSSSPSVSGVVGLFVGAGEHLDRYRSPFSPKIAYPGRGWLIEDEGVRSLEDGARQVEWKLLSSGTRRLVSYQWYEENYGLLAESARSFLALDRSPFYRFLPSLAVRITIDVPDTSDTSVELAHARLEEFYDALQPKLYAFYREILEYRAGIEQSSARLPSWVGGGAVLASTRRPRAKGIDSPLRP